MAITYGFFNSVNGDRKYNAEQIGRYLQGIVSSGVYADSSTSLQVLSNDGMAVEVQPGRAMLNYHYMENDSPLVLTLSAGGSLDRIDAIVARLDLTRRLCEIVVKQGTEASTPKAPTMDRTDTVKEYMLARVQVPRLSSAITQTNITDTRADRAVCGWVTGVIDQVDTSTLFAQWETAYNAAVAEMGAALEAQQQTFEEWYKALTDNYADGNVLPIPTPDDAGKLPTVSPDGSGYELRAPDSTLTNPGQAADAAATGKAIKAAQTPNILDNSDFERPVNHFIDSGDTVAAWNYCIDRWKSADNAVTVIFGDGYTRFSNIIQQALANPEYLNNKIFTAAVCTNSGEIVCASGRYNTVEQWTEFIRADGDEVGVSLCANADATYFEIRPSSGYMNIKWAALYEGEYTINNLPSYTPKGFAAELVNCYVSERGDIPGAHLLWTNGSPGLGWGTTPITLPSMNNYSWLMITYRSHKESAYYQRQFIPVANQGDLGTSRRVRLETVMGGGYYRDVVISETGLTFTYGKKYDTDASSNEYCTPMQIHGYNLT